MASSTTNYHFTLPADSDPASQTPYNENFTSLDTILKTQEDGIAAVTPTASTSSIDNTALATFYEGTITGELAAEITGSSALAGVVRAYKTSSTDSIQIAEAIDGTRVTRYYTSSAWSSSGGGGGATVNNATITIQKNGTTVDSFTSNQATDKTINITVPTSAADVSAIPTTAKGANSGVAELDANGKIPSSQLPSYVDDVIEGYYYDSKFYEDSEHTTEITGTTGKIYVDLPTNKTYRWSGSGYTEISESLALGETSSTAYRGDRGKTAYDHATDSSRHTTAETSGLYKFATTAEGHIASVSEVKKSDITELGIPGQDTTVGSGIVLTGYTSESPAQSDTIVATDNVNEAIKKLDERSRVDENNILTLYEEGVINLVDTDDKTGSTWINIPIELPAGNYVLHFDTLSSTASGTTCQTVFFAADNSEASSYIYPTRGNNITFDVMVTKTTSYLRIYAGDSYANSTGFTVEFTNLLVAKKESWEASSKVYQPYAMTNSELTAAIKALQAQLANQ